MPFGIKPECTVCSSHSSTMWCKNEENAIICFTCLSKSKAQKTPKNKKKSTGNSNNAPTEIEMTLSDDCSTNIVEDSNAEVAKENTQFNLRKSTRTKSQKNKQNPSKPVTPKSKSRKTVFKKHSYQTPTDQTTAVTCQSLFHKDQYFQVGDIVSLMSHEEELYYAQIHGLIQDQYCGHSAVITWLIPTQNSVKGEFDPSTYAIGPAEDIPRKLDFLEFVCHSPSAYFDISPSPFPVCSPQSEVCYNWIQNKPVPSD